MRINTVGKTSFLAGVGLLASVAAAGPQTRGYVVTWLAPAIHDTDSSCPEGFAAAADPSAVLSKIPHAAERERLMRPEHTFALCEALDGELAPSRFKVAESNIAYGFDLDRSDGKAAGVNSCAHENFVSPVGEAGIDNQWARVIGCIKEARPGGPLREYFNTKMRRGDFAILIEISGSNDLSNDDEVQVGFYSAANPAAYTGQSGSPKARMQVYYDRHFQNVTRGRIVKGVLTTEPIDMRFKTPLRMQMRADLLIRNARVKMELRPQGGLQGILGGYQEFRLLNRIAYEALDSDTVFGPLSCYRNYSLVAKSLVDGYPDPKKKGPCGWISVAYEVQAVPATIIHSQTQQSLAKRSDDAKPWWSKFLWWQR